MNRTTRLPVIALLLFAAGAIAGRWVLIGRDETQMQVEVTSASTLPSNTVTVDSTLRPIPEPSPFDDLQLTAFESGSDVSLVSSTETVTPDDEGLNAAATRSVIRQRYPDLPADALDGWVDTYQGLSLPELEELLAEKQMMAEFMPVSSFLKSSANTTSLLQTPTPVDGTFTTAIQVVKHNLLHATTPGFRRTVIRTAVPFDADAAARPLNVMTVFDFGPGPILRSENPLHLAIDDDGSHWFLLESGDLLTRQGAFARLEDGRLGIVAGDTTLRLLTDVRLPETAVDLQVASDGVFTYVAGDGGRTPAGTLQLAKVSDLSKISSVDGVYFTANDSSAFTITSEVSVRTAVLEAANVDSETEQKWLRHFEQLQAFE